MLVKRVIRLFFRDRANVFFSLLAVFIIIALYILFLGDTMEQSLQARLGFAAEEIRVVMASIVMAGIVAVTSVTGSMGALGISVADKRNAAKDFFTSPAPRGKITAGYLLGSAAVGLVMTLAALVGCVAYIALIGGTVPGPADCALLLLTAVLSVLCGNAMVFFLVIFVKSQNAFAAISTVVGSLIGFLTGIYLPVGAMPTPAQWVVKRFPISHAAAMFKQLLADEPLAALFAAAPLADGPRAQALADFREAFGVTISYANVPGGFWFSAGALAATTALCYGLGLWAMRGKRL